MNKYNIGIDCVKTAGWDMALHGMRNPMESWDSADSEFNIKIKHETISYWTELPNLGPNDLKLLLSLTRNGNEHRKVLRDIAVWFNITLPIYVWSEFDTYKIGVTRNSCSTMHKLGHRKLVSSDFAYNRVNPHVLEELNVLGECLREAREEENKGLETQCLKLMKIDLPGGYLQKATIACNYEALLNMFYQRRNHRLDEWREKNDSSEYSLISSMYSLTNMIQDLPYMDLLIEAKSKKGRKIKDIIKGEFDD